MNCIVIYNHNALYSMWKLQPVTKLRPYLWRHFSQFCWFFKKSKIHHDVIVSSYNEKIMTSWWHHHICWILLNQYFMLMKHCFINICLLTLLIYLVAMASNCPKSPLATVAKGCKETMTSLFPGDLRLTFLKNYQKSWTSKHHNFATSRDFWTK